MKMKMLCIGLAACSLAAIGGLAQETDVADTSASVSVSTETETDVTTEQDGKRQRNVRIERRLPSGRVEVEEYSADSAPAKKPTVRRRFQVIEDGNVVEDEDFVDDRIDIRPQIRVFPREKEMIIRRGKGQGEMRIELDSDDLDGAPLRRDLARVRRIGPRGDVSEIDAPIEHLEEAIRHLKKAKMADAAARLEGELEQLRSARKLDSDRLNEQLNSLREERDALKGELEKLKQQLDKLSSDGAKEKPEAGNRP